MEADRLRSARQPPHEPTRNVMCIHVNSSSRNHDLVTDSRRAVVKRAEVDAGRKDDGVKPRLVPARHEIAIAQSSSFMLSLPISAV
jgi:hypothetical protein